MVGFNDRVWGSQHQFSPFELALYEIDAVMQLGGKHQLGLAHREFKGAIQMRDEHSIGCMIGGGIVADKLQLAHDWKLLLQASLLLHDVGHYATSHVLEPVIPKQFHHEQILQLVLAQGRDFGALAAEPLHAVLKGQGVEPADIAAVIRGEHPLSTLVSNKVVDIDRLDYIARDLAYCNFNTTYNIERIISKLTFDGKDLGIKRSGLAAITLFLTIRSQAYDQIYLHPKTQVAETMLQYAVRSDPRLASIDEKAASFLHTMSDIALMQYLSHSDSARTRDLTQRIGRSKEEWYKPLIQLGGARNLETVRALFGRKERLEEELAAEGLLVSWYTGNTEKVLKRRETPKFSVDDGSDLFERAIPRATFMHIPEHMFAVYGPTGSAKEKEAAEYIVSGTSR